MANVASDRPHAGRHPRFNTASVAIQLRRLQDDGALIGVVVTVVFVTSFVFASIPRLYNDMSDRGLRDAIDGSPPYLRNIEMTRVARIPPPPSGDPYANIDAAGAKFQASLG